MDKKQLDLSQVKRQLVGFSLKGGYLCHASNSSGENHGGARGSGVVGRERMGTAFPHKKLSGNGVPTREFLRNI